MLHFSATKKVKHTEANRTKEREREREQGRNHRPLSSACCCACARLCVCASLCCTCVNDVLIVAWPLLTDFWVFSSSCVACLPPTVPRTLSLSLTSSLPLSFPLCLSVILWHRHFAYYLSIYSFLANLLLGLAQTLGQNYKSEGVSHFPIQFA